MTPIPRVRQPIRRFARRFLAGSAGTLTGVLALVAVVSADSFVNFESAHVRPLVLSPDGDRLFAVNTPDNRLEIYDVSPGGLMPVAEVAVGLEPVALAARTNLSDRTEVWVVNHLSDSVSVVEIDPIDVTLSRVVRTLLVGDEPRDLVFAGSAGDRAFVTTARRGQNSPVPPLLTTAGVGRALVWAFDANDLGAVLGGTPIGIVELFGDTPRSLAASPDGATVYAAVFHSGNQTMVLPESTVAANGGLPPPPPGSAPAAPSVGLIVKFDPGTGRWEDEIGRNWASLVPFSLPDQDVFLIDADANPPALVTPPNSVSGVGTILFNMAVRPDNGKLYVANTEALNEVRFEPLEAGGVQGHISESRITVITGTAASPVHLNQHIDYGVETGSQAEIEQSIAFPMDMAFSGDSQSLFVVAFGSAKVGVFDTDDLEAGVITEDQIEVGGGPSGLVLDQANDRLYVMNRFDHDISIVTNASDPGLRAETDRVPLGYDPSPPQAREGRQFLYDARDTSGHGDAACASCHIFGDFDSLAWNLGNPFGDVVSNPNPFRFGTPIPVHPMKGPMTTQSLRGMADAGPMHWRGDRTGGNDPGGDPLDEDAAFKKFNPAFVGLLGRPSELPAGDMQAFTDFILSLRYPPNPIRALDDVPTAEEAAGEFFFNNVLVDLGQMTCEFCHRLPLGTDGFSSEEGEPQQFKIAHLRNLYQKVGMFGVPPNGLVPPTGFMGDQVRGSGYLHDGSVATLFDFLNAPVFVFSNDTDRRNLEAFTLAFDTGLKPAVGQQVSATPDTYDDPTVIDRIDLLIERAEAGDCELVVKGVVAVEARGALYVGSGNFQPDSTNDPLLDSDSVRNLAATPGQEQVYTCVPPGSGIRMGLDRDEDGFFDRDEIDAGTDPADPSSFPGSSTTTTTTATTSTTNSSSTTTLPTPIHLLTGRQLSLRARGNDPSKLRLTLGSKDATITLGDGNSSADDPTIKGATLRQVTSAGDGFDLTYDLPAVNWRYIGQPGDNRGYGYKDRALAAGPIKSAKIKDGKLVKAVGKGVALGFALGQNPNPVGVVLTTGNVRYCMSFGGDTKYQTDRRYIARNAAAPLACPPPPGSPSGAFLESGSTVIE